MEKTASHPLPVVPVKEENMKKAILFLLAASLMLAMTACRRRIDPDGENIIYETVYQPTPVPMEGEGQQVPDSDLAADPNDTQKEIDPEGEAVDETIAAEGGETTPDAPDAPEKGPEITVTLDAMGGECSKETVKVNVGGVYGVLPVPAKAGQSFQGWFLEAEGGEPVNEITVVLAEEDHTLYAHWTTKTEFLLTFDPNGGRISPYSAEKLIYSGAVYGQLPEPIHDGFLFLGWFTEPEGGDQILPTDMVTVIDDQTVYAHWEYSPLDYWAFILKNTTQRVFTCQEVSVYLELEAGGTTMVHCPLVSDTGSKNIAMYEASGFASDNWVKEKKPNIIIKLTDSMGSAEATQTAVERRFPDARVYVFPLEAVEGTEAEQLYYKLRLAALCYPEYYYELDMDLIASELGVTENIHK